MGWIVSLVLSAALVAVFLIAKRREGALRAELRRIREQASDVEDTRRHELEEILDSMQDGVLLLGQGDQIVFHNKSFLDLFGLRTSCMGTTVVESLRNPEILDLVEGVRDRNLVSRYEIELPGLEARYLEINGARFGSDPKSVGDSGMILVFRDLTHIRQYERQRQDFVANVSHELRTPLSMISGYVETLISGAKDDPETAAKFLNVVQRHARRLTYLIEDLLTLSALEAGSVCLERSSLSAYTAANRVADDLRSKALAKGSRIDIDIDEGLRVDADARRLHQVLVNLVDNAVKYGAENMPVEIRALAQKRNGHDGVVFTVHNFGPEITKEAQARVFERFYRVDSGRSRELGGTGLGLSIVKHIIQLHQGEVGLESSADSGTTFSFWVPGEERANSETANPTASSSLAAVE